MGNEWIWSGSGQLMQYKNWGIAPKSSYDDNMFFDPSKRWDSGSVSDNVNSFVCEY
jgi:hypothetical protein